MFSLADKHVQRLAAQCREGTLVELEADLQRCQKSLASSRHEIATDELHEHDQTLVRLKEMSSKFHQIGHTVHGFRFAVAI